MVRPVTPEAEDAAAELEARQNGVYLGPLFSGGYPERLTSDYSPAKVPGLVRDDDLATIAAPLDFLGVNFYFPNYVGLAHPDGELRRGESWAGPGTVSVQPDGLPKTAMNWLVEPSSIRELLTRVVAPLTGELPIYITENGSSWYDYVTQDGRVEDYERVSYLQGHLTALHEAIADGVNLRGYFAWSLVDNFEWAEGYAKRFGLVYVDFATQQRILKLSGEFFAEVTSANALPAELEIQILYPERTLVPRHPSARAQPLKQPLKGAGAVCAGINGRCLIDPGRRGVADDVSAIGRGLVAGAVLDPAADRAVAVRSARQRVGLGRPAAADGQQRGLLHAPASSVIANDSAPTSSAAAPSCALPVATQLPADRQETSSTDVPWPVRSGTRWVLPQVPPISWAMNPSRPTWPAATQVAAAVQVSPVTQLPPAPPAPGTGSAAPHVPPTSFATNVTVSAPS